MGLPYPQYDVIQVSHSIEAVCKCLRKKIEGANQTLAFQSRETASNRVMFRVPDAHSQPMLIFQLEYYTCTTSSLQNATASEHRPHHYSFTFLLEYHIVFLLLYMPSYREKSRHVG